MTIRQKTRNLITPKARASAFPMFLNDGFVDIQASTPNLPYVPSTQFKFVFAIIGFFVQKIFVITVCMSCQH